MEPLSSGFIDMVKFPVVCMLILTQAISLSDVAPVFLCKQHVHLGQWRFVHEWHGRLQKPPLALVSWQRRQVLGREGGGGRAGEVSERIWGGQCVRRVGVHLSSTSMHWIFIPLSQAILPLFSFGPAKYFYLPAMGKTLHTSGGESNAWGEILWL